MRIQSCGVAVFLLGAVLPSLGFSLPPSSSGFAPAIDCQHKGANPPINAPTLQGSADDTACAKPPEGTCDQKAEWSPVAQTCIDTQQNTCCLGVTAQSYITTWQCQKWGGQDCTCCAKVVFEGFPGTILVTVNCSSNNQCDAVAEWKPFGSDDKCNDTSTDC